LYKMDYRSFLETHAARRAEITVGVVPVERQEASHFGILRMEKDWIVEFVEKPKEPDVLDRIELDVATARRAGIHDVNRRFLASMGIYVFNRDVLARVLRESSALDFGREVIPEALEKRRVRGYFFQDYWADIGTIGAFYQANVALTRPDPAFNLFDPNWPIYTSTRFLPASRIHDCRIHDSIVADGCVIEGVEIEGSVVGIRARIGRGTKVKEAVLLGADYYEDWSPGTVAIGVGRDCVIERAIIDKNARVGDRCVIRNVEGVVEATGDGYAIREGVVIVPKNETLPPGTRV
ncbi:MAG: sugar phosphate nucleotidyltransferase, partial [Candidatus Binatia bacterium]